MSSGFVRIRSDSSGFVCCGWWVRGGRQESSGFVGRIRQDLKGGARTQGHGWLGVSGVHRSQLGRGVVRGHLGFVGPATVQTSVVVDTGCGCKGLCLAARTSVGEPGRQRRCHSKQALHFMHCHCKASLGIAATVEAADAWCWRRAQVRPPFVQRFAFVGAQSRSLALVHGQSAPCSELHMVIVCVVVGIVGQPAPC